MHDSRNGALPPTNDIASLLIVAAAFVFIGWATSSYLIGACTGSASLPAQFHVLVRKKECMAIPVDSPKMHAGRIAAEKSMIRSAWGRWDLRQQLPPSSGPSDSSAGTTDALSTFARANFFFGRPCSLGCMHLMSYHGRCAPGCMKQGKLCCGRRGGRRRLGASEPVNEFDRRPFEHR